MSDDAQSDEASDPIAQWADSALGGLTLPEVFPDAAVVARLQRALARHCSAGPTAGEIFGGRHRLERPLGRGGMGVVWLAFDTELARPVAIKMLDGPADPLGLARMRREAQAVAQLAHPNIVAVYDVVLDAEPPFIVMEYVEDGDLRAWLDRTPRPSWRDVLAIFEQAGVGLDAAHRAGLVHRDFKPGNVIVGRGRARVVDFGLVHAEARPAATENGLLGVSQVGFTATGNAVGTPAYMAPEQHAEAAVTVAADVFAFACSLYEALYGERPFRAATLHELVLAKRAGPPASPPRTAIAAAVPPALYPILARGLAADPAARWPTMAEFLRALRRATPHRRWVRALLSAAAVSMLAWWAAAGGDACAGDVASRDHAWVRRREDIARALDRAGVSTPLAREVDRTLREFGEQWSEQANAACSAGESAAALRECLADLREAAGARLDRAVTGPSAARSLAHEVDVFLSLDECGTEALQGLQPVDPDPQIRREVAALRAWSEEPQATRTDEAPEMIARAEATGHQPTLARVHLGIAYRHDAVGEAAQSLASCERGFVAATAGGAEFLVLATAAACVAACSNLGRVDDARRWMGHVEAMVQRLGIDPMPHLRGRVFLASALARAGELEAARQLADEVDRRARRGPGWSKPLLVALAELGMVAIWLDDYAVAIERLELGRSWAEEYFDDDDETMSMLEGRLATAYRYVGRHDDAEALFVRTLQRSLAPVQRSMTQLNFAQMLADQPTRLADAYAVLEPAYDKIVADGELDSIEAGHVLAALGQLHIKAGRREDARSALLQARAIYARLLEPGHIHARNVEIWLAKLDDAR